MTSAARPTDELLPPKGRLMGSTECWNRTRFQKTDQARLRDANHSAESSAVTTQRRHGRSTEFRSRTGSILAHGHRHGAAPPEAGLCGRFANESKGRVSTLPDPTGICTEGTTFPFGRTGAPVVMDLQQAPMCGLYLKGG